MLDEDDEEGSPSKPKAAAGDAFEDVLYGSESELDSSDEEEEAGRPAQQSAKRAGGAGGARLRVDDDDPMDLLAGAATHITSTLKALIFKYVCDV